VALKSHGRANARHFDEAKDGVSRFLIRFVANLIGWRPTGSGVQIARSHGSSQKASAKSVAEFETFVSVACLRPAFADLAERTAVHDRKFAARVKWLNGH
jgi:hypothetical protein